MRGKMQKPFYFYTRLTLVELSGKTARNVKELWEGINTVPSPCIYHHTHRFLEQHQHYSPEYPNDFSFWITYNLGLKKLGERIASVDIVQFSDIENLRKRIADILEDYVITASKIRDCIAGEEFHFLSSRIFILTTPFAAHNLQEFLECMEKVSVHSLYFHIFESRLRIKRQGNDFSAWLRDSGYPELADKISRLDPYTHTMEGLRKKIIRLVKEELKK